MSARRSFLWLYVMGCLAVGSMLVSRARSAEDAGSISYYTQIRPILQANCQGCHQSARPEGGYVMTVFDRMLAGGESESAAIVPGKPEESYLVELITPVEGVAEMPQEKDPLDASDVELIRDWVLQGAIDDTPQTAQERFDPDHPPIYTRPPVITSLDYSPDGKLLAVAGFHEVLLVSSDGGELVARLIGMSERIESVSFSPDGKRLAVTGGSPARLGELQVWDVAARELLLSVPITEDTVYGGKWSPDGKLIALGCADTTVRAVDAATGEQVLFQNAHEDWVRDTVFSKDGSHLVSVARDMTCKLTEVATERFVDNVTSITPGALKGGISAVARHPQRDEIVVGGADGVPKVYRMHRVTKRVIGDDANLIRRLPAMEGRIQSLAVSEDGRRLAAGSALDGHGAVHVYSYEFDPSLSDELKKILAKRVQTRVAKEHAQVEAYRTRDVRQISATSVPESGVYAVAFHPNGTLIAAAGSDGAVRLIETESGKQLSQFWPAPVSDVPVDVGERPITFSDPEVDDAIKSESIPAGTRVTSIAAEPREIELTSPFEYAQLVVSAKLDSGDMVDVTRLAHVEVSAPVIEVSATGLVRPVGEGSATLLFNFDDQIVQVPVNVSGLTHFYQASFVRDVAPVMSKLGCNAGTCHGSAQGKNGFKLSLRGYDPLFDVRALTDDFASRRVNVAAPDNSLMLLKCSASVPHVGGQLTKPGDPYYEVIRNWIASGAQLDSTTPQVVSIELFPKNPVIQRIGSRQQIRVVATYADGDTRDVTQQSTLESGDSEIATAADLGLMTALRRGEAPVLARFEGAYAATTLTVMGDRTGFVWEDPPVLGKVDQLVADKWQRMRIRPSKLCSDTEFIRRIYLDVTGLPPSADNVREFVADQRDTRVKRDELVDRLIGSEQYIELWTNKWADLLQVNRKFLGPEGASAFRQWIRNEVAENTPYDQFVRKILTASGSNKDNPAASYFKVLRDPEQTLENTTHLFLAVRFNCNKCHDHPFERWTQDQYYETAAFFAQYQLTRDPASGKRNIGGTAVEGAKPLYEIVSDRDKGEVKHVRTGQVVPPEFPFDCDFATSEKASRREQLANWITSPDNPYFARSYVNRLWGYLLGVGLIEPLDDVRAGNPPTNPDLLGYLTDQFIDSGFDVRHVLRLICKSRTYQLSIETNQWNEDDAINYSHATARRLPAEVLFDAIHAVTGSPSKIPGVKPGTRAAELPDVGVKLPSGFLANFGRPPRESSCECERSSDMQLGPIMALVSGPTVADAIAAPDNAIAKLVDQQSDDRKVINELFMRVLNRPARQREMQLVIDTMQSINDDHERLAGELEQREQHVKSVRPQRVKAREEAIAAAKAELDAYQKAIGPRIEQEQRKQAEAVKRAQADLKAYEQQIPEKVAGWWKDQRKDVEWHLLEPSQLQSTNNAKLTRLPDRSIRASGNADRGTYTITVNTHLTGITAIRLEALADSTIEGGGPGLASNGNFVVTEFEFKAAPKSNPKDVTEVTLHKPQADFAQTSFSVQQAIDNQPRGQQGWAVSPSGGVVHWATFQTKKPIGYEGGSVLRFEIHQYHIAKDHRLGRFRISASTDPQPVGLSLPENLKAVVSVAVDQRSDEQKAALLAYLRKVEPEYLAQTKALADARKPLPVDPGVRQRTRQLNYVSRPLPEDSKLGQLKKDVEFSKKQLQNKRLTAAQDLVWALINNPAFLFNR